MFQDEWLSTASDFLAENVFGGSEVFPTLFDQINGIKSYGGRFCPDEENVECWIPFLKGQNLQNLFLKLKMQNSLLPAEDIFSSSFVDVEPSGSSLCTSITNITREGFESQSGVGNGMETIIDLETFDNGDLAMNGDGADIQVLGQDEYSLAQLKGFSVSPGSAVEVHIRPVLFGISEKALRGFDYLKRKCVEPSVDGRGNLTKGGLAGSYSLSNCLVAATLTEIKDK